MFAVALSPLCSDTISFAQICYDESDVVETQSFLTVTVLGTYQGYWLESKNDDEEEPVIDLEVTVSLKRCAGRISFEEPEVDVVAHCAISPNYFLKSTLRHYCQIVFALTF
jgi:hypothetical protein